MQKIKSLIIIAILFLSLTVKAQCIIDLDYKLDNYSHIDCYGDNAGAIDITIINTNSSFWWTGPNGFTSNSLNLANLFTGQYVLTIMENLIPGDTSSTVTYVCHDSISIEQTIEVSAIFELSSMCNEYDSANVKTTIWGGTTPYQTTLWSTGDTSGTTSNLAPQTTPYTLTVIDANSCSTILYLTIDRINGMNPFMSSIGVT